MADLQYPIGKLQLPTEPLNESARKQAIADIAEMPTRLRTAVGGLTPEQLDTPYRPGGWTVRQVVHHLADAHVNGYIRFKSALTEDTPPIRAYDEKAWAELPDGRAGAVEFSLNFIDGMHRRWAEMLREMKPEQFARQFQHPVRGLMSLDTAIAMYSWHSKHHIAHITSLRERMGW